MSQRHSYSDTSFPILCCYFYHYYSCLKFSCQWVNKLEFENIFFLIFLFFGREWCKEFNIIENCLSFSFIDSRMSNDNLIRNVSYGQTLFHWYLWISYSFYSATIMKVYLFIKFSTSLEFKTFQSNSYLKDEWSHLMLKECFSAFRYFVDFLALSWFFWESGSFGITMSSIESLTLFCIIESWDC